MRQEPYFLPHREVMRKMLKMLPQVTGRWDLTNLVIIHMRKCNIEFHPNNMGYSVRCKLGAVNGRNGLNHDEFITVYNSIFDALYGKTRNISEFYYTV